jgi:Lar family restriction alleviation protein
MAELKKCPFCGGEVKGYADNHKKVMIECKNCNMYFGVQLEIGCELVEGWKAMFDSKEELFEAWNNRATEAEIRAKAIDEFAEKCKELVKQGELYDYVRWCNWNNSIFKWFDRVAEQLKEE